MGTGKQRRAELVGGWEEEERGKESAWLTLGPYLDDWMTREHFAKMENRGNRGRGGGYVGSQCNHNSFIFVRFVLCIRCHIHIHIPYTIYHIPYTYAMYIYTSYLFNTRARQREALLFFSIITNDKWSVQSG